MEYAGDTLARREKAASCRGYSDMVEILAEEKGELSPEEHALIMERLQRLVKIQKRAKQFLPSLEKLIR